jgi:import inner membrane translocase subunit TIM16
MVNVYRIVLNLLLSGGQIFGRAFVDAWKQAPLRAKAGSQISLAEAQKILGLTPPYQLKDVTARYEKLFKANDPANGGSFYLQSKVYRARERLTEELTKQPETPKATS